MLFKKKNRRQIFSTKLQCNQQTWCYCNKCDMLILVLYEEIKQFIKRNIIPPMSTWIRTWSNKPQEGKKYMNSKFMNMHFLSNICKLKQQIYTISLSTIQVMKDCFKEFPGGTVVRILCFYCRELGFNPWLGTRIPWAKWPKNLFKW